MINYMDIKLSSLFNTGDLTEDNKILLMRV